LNRNIKGTFSQAIQINGLGAPGGVWNGDGVPPDGTNWVIVVHPSRDLALVHRWPIADTDPAKGDVPTREPRLPVLPVDPPMSAQRLKSKDRIDSLLGFGCTNLPSPKSGNSILLFEGAMLVDAVGLQSAVSTNTTLSSWTARLLPLPSGDPTVAPNFIGRGDSGGPARTTRDLGFDIQGANESQSAAAKDLHVSCRYVQG
jgi:hypothetical protein